MCVCLFIYWANAAWELLSGLLTGSVALSELHCVLMSRFSSLHVMLLMPLYGSRDINTRQLPWEYLFLLDGLNSRLTFELEKYTSHAIVFKIATLDNNSPLLPHHSPVGWWHKGLYSRVFGLFHLTVAASWEQAFVWRACQSACQALLKINVICQADVLWWSMATVK